MKQNENEEQRSSSRKKGAILSYFYSAAQILINLLYVPLLIRGLGSEEYGLFQLIGSIMAYIAIMDTMFSGGVTRFYCKFFFSEDEKGMENSLAVCRGIYRVVSVLALVVGFFAAIVVRFVYADVLTDFQLNETSIMLLVLIVNLIVTMHNAINVAVINAHERFVFLKCVQILSVVLQPVIVICLIQSLPFAATICCIQLAANCCCALAQKIFARKVLKAKVKRHYKDNALLKEILVYSGAILLAVIADQIFWKTNQLILGAIYGMGVVAVYAVAMQVAQTAYQPLGTAVTGIFLPRLSELYFKKENIPAISDLFTSVGRIVAYPLTLVLFGFIVFGRDFIYLWAGPGFEDAYWIALAVMIPFTIDLMQNLGIAILQVMNKYGFRGRLYLFMSIINIIFVLMVIPHYGAIGAAVVSGIAMFIGNGIVMNWYYSKKIGLDIWGYWKNIFRILVPLIVFLFVASFVWLHLPMRAASWGVLLLGIGIFSISFLLISYCCSMNGYEKGLIKRVVCGGFRKKIG